jgi:hypothetical protein
VEKRHRKALAIPAQAGSVRRRRDHRAMLTLAFTLKTHTGIRLAEVGEAVGAIGGLAFLVGGLMPFGRRAGEILGGLALAIAFVCLVIATRWGHFH